MKRNVTSLNNWMTIRSILILNSMNLGAKWWNTVKKGEVQQRLRIKAWIQQLWLDLGMSPCRFAAPQNCWDGCMCLALQLFTVSRGLVVHSRHLFRGSRSGLKDTALSAATAAHRSHSHQLPALGYMQIFDIDKNMFLGFLFLHRVLFHNYPLCS